MSLLSRSFGSVGVVSCAVAGALMAACAGTARLRDRPDDDTSGAVAGKPNNGATGGMSASTGGTGTGTSGTGTGTGTGGSDVVGSGGTGSAGRAAASGGSGGTTGGNTSAGGMHATGGTGGSSGGMVGTTTGGGAGGRAAMGGNGGTIGHGGTTSSAGASSGGTSAAGAPSTGADPCATTTTPSGGMEHASNNASGTAAGLTWTIWSNNSGGSITTYSTPAFSAAWNNAGDFLARVGLQWDQTKTYEQYGTITAQYSSKKSGNGGDYSYIGIYGWSVSPCVEWYIVDDSYDDMPVTPGNASNKGTVTIDGGAYTLYSHALTGTGISKCSGASSWTQFFSVRQSARQCGTISISQHFDAWAKAGMALGKMDQAQILVEVGGGNGSIDFPVANVTTTM